MSATFTARFVSRCGLCDETIREGDACTWADDEVVHLTCPTPVAMADPCSGCFMVPATNGECGCDE